MAVFFQRNQGSTRELKVPLDGPMASWVGGRFAKICLSLEDEPALLQAYEEARKRGLPCAIITDAGRTEFHGVPTKTAVAIGPAAVTEIDAITGPGGLVDCKLA
jgi:PTH2 family peptidyl-tRNA hydrolase